MNKLYAIATLLILSIFPLTAQADEQQEVQAAFADWRNALSNGKAENVVNLYDRNAILLATLAKDPLTTQAERTTYFEGLVSREAMKATVNKQFVSLLDDDNAVISGIYTFSFKDAGKTVEIPARFTFVYAKHDGKWLILEHHSSVVPK